MHRLPPALRDLCLRFLVDIQLWMLTTIALVEAYLPNRMVRLWLAEERRAIRGTLRMMHAVLVYAAFKEAAPRRRSVQTIHTDVFPMKRRRLIRFFTRGSPLHGRFSSRCAADDFDAYRALAKRLPRDAERLIPRALVGPKEVERVAPAGASALLFTPAPQPTAADTS
jgi:hypothetical protein